MKFVTYETAAGFGWGVLDGETVFALGDQGSHRSLREAITADALAVVARQLAEAPRLALADLRLAPVIPDPGKILCVGLNYQTHRAETGRDETAHPAIFIRFADSQLGHGEPIVRPRVSTFLDYEGELAIVIGRSGRYISRDEAMEHVAGYACYNDATIRDWQRHTIQFTPGKNFPCTGGFGPCLVTADEVGDYRRLTIATRVNGETVQSARLDQLIFDIPTIIEYCSAFTPLSPGDVIATGTPGGVGFKREPQLLLKAGDRVEVDIPGVGLLVNGVVDER